MRGIAIGVLGALASLAVACGGGSTGGASESAGDERADERVVERSERPAPAGREGDVCGWGERSEAASAERGETLPEPAPCGEGLTCCYGGGVAGLDSHCMRVANGECPAYP